MTKDVLITIRGVHTMDEEDNDVEMIVRGDYYQKNGKHYVLYEELLEGFKEPVKNIIKITPTSMDITKKGTATTHMLFEKNRKNISCYSTPLGEMVVGIQANHFAVDEQADSLKVNVMPTESFEVPLMFRIVSQPFFQKLFFLYGVFL
jgi:uncharacterized beta-barrel protein YwiB (DUF1934 family)